MTPCRRCLGREDYCLRCAAAYLNVSDTTLRRMIHDRQHPVFIQLPRGGRRFPIVELEAFKRRHTRRPPPPLAPAVPAHFGGLDLVERARRDVMQGLERPFSEGRHRRR